jgi:hypothetical protein
MNLYFYTLTFFSNLHKKNNRFSWQTPVLFCLFLGFTHFAKAQTLYTILAVDGSEHKHNGHFFNLKRFQLETDTIAQFANLEKQEIVIDESILTKASIDSVIQLINPTKKDVIFFYFSGNEYLQQVGKTDKQVLKLSKSYLEYEVLQKMLKAKNARFTLLIVDLCNTISNDRIVSLKVAPAKEEKYKKLFGDTQGEIWAINHFPHEQHDLVTTVDGTFFSNGFVHALHEDRSDVRWEAVMSRAKYLTISESGGKQNPQLQVNIRNKEPEPQNFNNPNNISGGQPADDYNKQPKLRPNDHNGNFTAPTNTKATSDGKTVKGGNFDKKSDAFATEMTSDKKAMLSQQSLELINNFQNKIATIALGSSSNESGANEAELIESAMLLFSDNSREIGISSVKRGSVRKKVNRYFRKLYGIGNKFKIAVTWFQPTEIEPLQPQTDGTYTTVATVFQEFRKTNKSGKLVYGDKVNKKVYLTLKPDASETTGFKILINDIQIVEGTTVEITE